MTLKIIFTTFDYNFPARSDYYFSFAGCYINLYLDGIQKESSVVNKYIIVDCKIVRTFFETFVSSTRIWPLNHRLDPYINWNNSHKLNSTHLNTAKWIQFSDNFHFQFSDFYPGETRKKNPTNYCAVHNTLLSHV